MAHYKLQTSLEMAQRSSGQLQTQPQKRFIQFHWISIDISSWKEGFLDGKQPLEKE